MSEPRNLQDAMAQGMGYIRARWPRLYLALKHHRTTQKQEMTFDDRPWLLALYQDNDPYIVVRKCVQVGISEWALCEMFNLARQGKRGMYLLPDDSWCSTFVGDRLDGLLSRVEEYRAATKAAEKETDSRRMKSIYGSTWKFAGTTAKSQGSTMSVQKAKAAFEFQASALLIDEHDEHIKERLAWFNDRLASEKNPIIRVFGNPSIDGTGIAKKYSRTDAKIWEVQCPGCGHHQELDWYQHFVQERTPGGGEWELRDTAMSEVGEPRPVCTRCGVPFDRCGHGRWRSTNPRGVGSGYAVSRLFVNVRPTDIRELWDKFLEAQNDQSLLSNFHNQWLGVPYVHKDDKLTEDNLARVASRAPLSVLSREAQVMLRGVMVAGLDQGKGNHLAINEVIDGKTFTRALHICEDLDQAEVYIRAYKCSGVVIDAGGGSYAQTREFVQRLEGSAMCYYRPKDEVTALYVLDEEKGVIKCNRTEIIDRMVASFKNQARVIPGDWESACNGQYKKQMLMPVRMLDARGYPIWTGGNDHFFHAEVYAYLAMLMVGESGVPRHKTQKEKTSWRVR